MPPSSSVGRSLVAAVRAYFGITQQEMAQYLGLSPMQVSHLETGRRGAGIAVLRLLSPLADQVRPDASAAPTAADLGTPDRAPLEARLDYCRHHAARVRRLLRPLEAQATVAGRWRAALPVLFFTARPALTLCAIIMT